MRSSGLFEPPAGLDDAEEVEGLRAAVAYHEALPGQFIDHPTLGPFTRSERDRFHRAHRARHLGFAPPTRG